MKRIILLFFMLIMIFPINTFALENENSTNTTNQNHDDLY